MRLRVANLGRSALKRGPNIQASASRASSAWRKLAQPLAPGVVGTTTKPREVLKQLRRGQDDDGSTELLLRAIGYSHGRLDPGQQDALELLAPFEAVVPLRFTSTRPTPSSLSFALVVALSSWLMSVQSPWAVHDSPPRHAPARQARPPH